MYTTQYVADATTFVAGVTRWACQQSLGLFHFAYVDACPAGGCLAGCPSKPLEGNGYFGPLLHEAEPDAIARLSLRGGQ